MQARLRGVSVEQEARRVLAEGTQPTRTEIAARAAAIRARQRPHRSRLAVVGVFNRTNALADAYQVEVDDAIRAAARGT